MMGYLADHIEGVFVFFIGVAIFQAIKDLRKSGKDDKAGIESGGVVSRIEEQLDSETAASSFTSHAEFTDREGARWENPR